MDIGKEKEKITVEPIQNPVPQREPTPSPDHSPEPERHTEQPEPVKVGEDQSGEEIWIRSSAGFSYKKRLSWADDRWQQARDHKDGDIF